MYYDLTTEQLQNYLLSESILNDAILEDDTTWQNAVQFHSNTQDSIACDQLLDSEELLVDN